MHNDWGQLYVIHQFFFNTFLKVTHALFFFIYIYIWAYGLNIINIIRFLHLHKMCVCELYWFLVYCLLFYVIGVAFLNSWNYITSYISLSLCMWWYERVVAQFPHKHTHTRTQQLTHTLICIPFIYHQYR